MQDMDDVAAAGVPAVPTRRALLRAAGAGAAAAAVGGAGLVPTPARAAVRPGALGTAGTARAAGAVGDVGAVGAAGAASAVDFWLGIQEASVDPAGTATVPVTVGNAGTAAAAGDLEVILVSPFYFNFDPSSLPPQFTSYVVEEPAPNIPQVIQLTVPAADLGPGSEFSFDVGLVEVPGGPLLADYVTGYALAAGDPEATLLNNEGDGIIGLPVRPLPVPPPGANPVNPYFTFLQPRLSSGKTTHMVVYVGNHSPNALTQDAVFTFVTPYNVKIDRNDIAFKLLNPTYHHDLTDPRIPDVVSVPVRRLALLPDPNLLIDLLSLNTITIPLIGYDGAYTNRGGKASLAVSRADFDVDLGTSIEHISVIQP